MKVAHPFKDKKHCALFLQLRLKYMVLYIKTYRYFTRNKLEIDVFMECELVLEPFQIRLQFTIQQLRPEPVCWSHSVLSIPGTNYNNGVHREQEQQYECLSRFVELVSVDSTRHKLYGFYRPIR